METYPTIALQPGSTDTASVKQLQDYLVSQGYMTQAQVNTGYGIYGPKTTAAVLALQKAKGVDYSTGPGYWGPRTVAALNTPVAPVAPVNPLIKPTPLTPAVPTPKPITQSVPTPVVTAPTKTPSALDTIKTQLQPTVEAVKTLVTPAPTPAPTLTPTPAVSVSQPANPLAAPTTYQPAANNTPTPVNPLIKPTPLTPAPVAPVSPTTSTYTVVAGDTLSAIAKKLGVPMSSITGYKSGDPNKIGIGEVLTVGGTTAPITPQMSTIGQPGAPAVVPQPAPAPIVPTQAEQTLMTQFGATAEQIKDPTFIQSKIDEVSQQITTLSSESQTPENNQTREQKIQEFVDLLASKGIEFSPDMISAMFPQPGKTEQELKDELYTKYGIADLEEKFAKYPTKTYEETYQTIIDQMGLTDLKTQINDVISKISQADADYATASGKINENPWLQESGRVGEQTKLSQAYELTKKNLTSQETLLQNLYDKSKEQAITIASNALTAFYKERDYTKEELDYYIARADADLEAQMTLRAQTAQEEAMRYYPEYVANLPTAGSELLTIDEATKLSLPYGTTKAQAAAAGITITPETKAPDTVKTDEGTFQYNPATGMYDIRVGGAPTTPAGKAEVLQDSINLVDGVLTNKDGLSETVGTNAAGRIQWWSWLTGNAQKFIGGVEQIISQKNLDALINAKAAGATFGALSDNEGRMLASAASKIGTWKIVDSSGKVKGYNIDEASFVAELNQIKTLAQRAIEKSGGTGTTTAGTATEGWF